MPPSLALLICTLFVLSLLVLESRRCPEVSAAMWIPSVWFLIVSSRSLGAWFKTTVNNESGSVLDEVVLLGLTSVAILVLSRRRIDWAGTLRRNKWLLMVLAYMFVSTLWSDIPFLAMKRWVREVIAVVMALVTMSERNQRLGLETVLRRAAYVLIPYSVLLIRYYPALGRQYGKWSGIEMWTGAAGQKNGLGRLCMISILFLLWALYRQWNKRAPLVGPCHRWADASVIAIAVYLLIGSNSSTSLATLIIGSTSYLGLTVFRKLKWRVPEPGLLAVVVFLICFGVSSPFLGGSNIAGFSSSLGRDDTLTGRTEVWADLVPVVKTRPLWGFGFGSFWTDDRRTLYDIPTAHNGYLDVLLELGTGGLVVYAIWLLSCARLLRRALTQDYDWAALAICFLLISLIYNCTESALNSLTEQMTAVVVLTSMGVPAMVKRARPAASTLQFNPSGSRQKVGIYGGNGSWWG